MESAITKVTREKTEVLAVLRSAPWWIWVVAASFVLHFGLIVKNDWAGATLGLHAAYQRGSIVVQDVYARSESVPLQQGDRIIRADNQVIASDGDWFGVLFNLQVGKPVIFDIRRDTQDLQVSVTPGPRRSVGYFNLGALVFVRIVEVMMLAVACFVAFARPRNSAALLLALFFSGLSMLNTPETLSGFAATLRDLPWPLLGLLFIPSFGGPLMSLFLFLFCITFPRRLIQSPWILTLLCIPPLVWSIRWVVYTYRLLHDPARAFGMYAEDVYIGVFVAAYLFAAPCALALNYRRLTDVNERRRVRVLVLGLVVGLFALVSVTLVRMVPSLRDGVFGRFVLLSSSGVVLAISAVLLFPASFAYAVLRHRLFDVRIIIRQGLQYAMARGVLLSIMPLLLVILVADILLHSDQSLAVIITARAWIYGVVGVVAIVLYQKRQGWLDQIDRLFFRDQFDAQCLLQDLIQRVKSAKDLDVASHEVVARIHRALHSEFVCVLHRRADQTEFRTMVCEPANHRTIQFHADVKLLGLLRLMEKPLQVSGTTWLADRLPDEEFRFIEEQNIDLVIPIVTGSAAAESILVLGPKRSEEPYSREDERLLTAIAASLALLSTSSIAQPETQSFQECPTCGACFNRIESRCNQDGSGLVRIHMPRVLAGRYRLDRRIGSGGMGTVYAGVDDALDRPIATKVIRPELVQNPHVTAKFHQEARAAAGLVHRNVITIYDFGVERQHPFIIMELLAGRTLRTELDPAKPFSPKRTIEILDGVCAAIEEAHRRKLLHRDLKPENIFLAQTPTGELVKVLDFGLVKALTTSIRSDDPTRAATSVIAGTPYYMAPEQLMGEPASQATDVWALGVIAYEMLIGAHPFVTGSEASWQKAIFKGCFTSVRAHRQDVSPNWQAFFERVFQPEPKQRIGSAGIFLAELLLALKSADQKTKANS